MILGGVEEPASIVARKPSRRIPPLRVAAAVLALGGLFLAFQIVVRIRDKNDKETVINIAPESTVTLEKAGHIVAEVPSTATTGAPVPTTSKASRPPSIVIEPIPSTLKPGDPLSQAALVRHPATIAGLTGWTIETRRQRGANVGVAYDPDGRWLALAGDDGSIRLFDSRSGRLDRVLVGHASRIAAIAWHPGGTVLASAGVDATIRLWDVPSGRTLRVLRGSDLKEQTLAWSPDGKMLAASGGQPTRLWDAVTGKSVGEISENIGGGYSMAWSPDSSQMAVVDGDPNIRIWDVPTSTVKLSIASGSPESPPNCVAWSPDGTTLAVGYAQDNRVILWNARSGERLRSLEGCAYVSSLSWSPNGKTLAAGGVNAVTLWNSDAGRLLQTLSNQSLDITRALAWSPDGKLLTGTHNDGRVLVWEAETGRRVRSACCTI